MSSKLDEYIEKRIKEKLSLYCKEALSRGRDPKHLRAELVAKGHSPRIVDEVIREHKGDYVGSSTSLKEETPARPSIEPPPSIEEIKRTESRPKSDPKLNISQPIKKDPPKTEEAKAVITQKPQESRRFASIREHPRRSIAILMVVLFLFSVAYYFVKDIEHGIGTCPYVSLTDARKVGNLYLERNQELSFVEMDQLLATYLGKTDCTLVDSGTVRRLRSIELEQ